MSSTQTHEAPDSTGRPAESDPVVSATPSQLKRQLQVSELQVKLSEAKEKLADLRRPWWRSASSVTVVAGLLAAVLPATELVKGWIEASRAKMVEAETRVEAARSSYLDRSLNGTNQERLAVLRFIIKTSGDETLRSWAREEKELVEKQIEDELEISKAQAEAEEHARAVADLVPSLIGVGNITNAARPGGTQGQRERTAEEVRKHKERAVALRLRREELIANLKLPLSAPMAQQARSPTILWVDATPADSDTLRLVFETAGVQVVRSPSTQEAERLLSEQRFDLIICGETGGDRPQAAGYELLKSVREQNRAVPFIFYAGGASLPARRAEATRLGASGSTDAPWELVRLVSDYLNLDLQPGAGR